MTFVLAANKAEQAARVTGEPSLQFLGEALAELARAVEHRLANIDRDIKRVEELLQRPS